jgi:hypothetical protein
MAFRCTSRAPMKRHGLIAQTPLAHDQRVRFGSHHGNCQRRCARRQCRIASTVGPMFRRKHIVQ